MAQQDATTSQRDDTPAPVDPTTIDVAGWTHDGTQDSTVADSLATYRHAETDVEIGVWAGVREASYPLGHGYQYATELVDAETGALLFGHAFDDHHAAYLAAIQIMAAWEHAG